VPSADWESDCVCGERTVYESVVEAPRVVELALPAEEVSFDLDWLCSVSFAHADWYVSRIPCCKEEWPWCDAYSECACLFALVLKSDYEVADPSELCVCVVDALTEKESYVSEFSELGSPFEEFSAGIVAPASVVKVIVTLVPYEYASSFTYAWETVSHAFL